LGSRPIKFGTATLDRTANKAITVNSSIRVNPFFEFITTRFPVISIDYLKVVEKEACKKSRVIIFI
jgi:hypothetical protein